MTREEFEKPMTHFWINETYKLKAKLAKKDKIIARLKEGHRLNHNVACKGLNSKSNYMCESCKALVDVERLENE